MLLLLRVGDLGHSLQLILYLSSFMIDCLNLQLHVIPLLYQLVTLQFKVSHFKLIIFLSLLKLCMLLVRLLGLHLTPG